MNRFAAVLTFSLLIAARPALAAETYTVTPIPTRPGDSSFGVYGLNANGQVIANSGPSNTSFLWQQGIVTTIPPVPGDDGVDLRDLTDDGRVLGNSYGPGRGTSFVFDHGTRVPLPPLAGALLASVSDINRFGIVCGYSLVDNLPVATVWEDALPTALPPVAGFDISVAWCLNDAGVVAGSLIDLATETHHLALGTNGTLVDQGEWPGVRAMIAFAINESNVIVGAAQAESGNQFPFRWDDGTFEALPMLAGFDGGFAQDVNEKGQIVGVLTNSTTAQSVGVIWEAGVPLDVETLFEPGATVDVDTLSSINDRGQIAGQGFFDATTYGGFLLTPHVAALAGNVNVQNGPPANVLLVNGSSGDDAARTITLARDAAIEITMDRPPAMPGDAGFALYVFAKAPNASTVAALPFGIGDAAMKMPPSGAGAQPLKIWNNIGKPGVLGAPDFPSSPAPSTVLNRPTGLGRVGTFTFQGIIRDSASPSGIAAVTNGIVVQTH